MAPRRLTTDRLELITATPQHILVELDDPHALGRLMAAHVPDSWHVDEEDLKETLHTLHEGPHHLGWWFRYIVVKKGPDGKRVLAGTVGLEGPPAEGAVLIACSIVPELQAEGFAPEALGALMDWAFDQDGVDRVVSDVSDDGARENLDALGFEPQGAGPKPGTTRHAKPRETWLEEGPPSRRAPKIIPQPANTAIPGLPPVAKKVFKRLMAEPLREVDALRAEVNEYVAYIEQAAATNPYVDSVLARDIARVCGGLFDAIVDTTPEHTRRQIQAAARYFVTEEDGDSDLGIGGLDEDGAVANAVAEHLGRSDLVSGLL